MGIGSHTCSRCNITTPYISRESFERAEANLKNCSKCQNIPDESIKFLHDEGKYGKLCPNCGQPQFYPNKIGLFQALRLNSWCSSCAAKVCAPMNQIKIKARRENMTPEQRAMEKQRKSEACKKAWLAKTPEEKQVALEHLKREREKYLENLTPEQRDQWLENMRKTFAKYRGNKHWMTRPETMAKMHSSYMQYMGKNHWIHKPGVLNKILQTKKNNRLQKLADI